VIARAWQGVRTGRSSGGIYGMLIALSVVLALSVKEEPSAAVMAAGVAGSPTGRGCARRRSISFR
jgi:hypothetical protein